MITPQFSHKRSSRNGRRMRSDQNEDQPSTTSTTDYPTVSAEASVPSPTRSTTDSRAGSSSDQPVLRTTSEPISNIDRNPIGVADYVIDLGGGVCSTSEKDEGERAPVDRDSVGDGTETLVSTSSNDVVNDGIPSNVSTSSNSVVNASNDVSERYLTYEEQKIVENVLNQVVKDIELHVNQDEFGRQLVEHEDQVDELKVDDDEKMADEDPFLIKNILDEIVHYIEDQDIIQVLRNQNNMVEHSQIDKQGEELIDFTQDVDSDQTIEDQTIVLQKQVQDEKIASEFKDLRDWANDAIKDLVDNQLMELNIDGLVEFLELNANTLITINGFNCAAYELRHLRRNQWLSDMQIERSISIIQVTSPRQFDYMDSIFLALDESQVRKHVDLVFQRGYNKGLIFAYVHCNGNHWCCIAVDITNMRIVLFDPKQERLNYAQLSRLVKKFIAPNLKGNFANYKQTNFESFVQSDANNCGIYVIDFIDNYVNGTLSRFYPAPTPKQELKRTQFLRLKILSNLVSASSIAKTTRRGRRTKRRKRSLAASDEDEGYIIPKKTRHVSDIESGYSVDTEGEDDGVAPKTPKEPMSSMDKETKLATPISATIPGLKDIPILARSDGDTKSISKMVPELITFIQSYNEVTLPMITHHFAHYLKSKSDIKSFRKVISQHTFKQGKLYRVKNKESISSSPRSPSAESRKRKRAKQKTGEGEATKKAKLHDGSDTDLDGRSRKMLRKELIQILRAHQQGLSRGKIQVMINTKKLGTYRDVEKVLPEVGHQKGIIWTPKKKFIKDQSPKSSGSPKGTPEKQSPKSSGSPKGTEAQDSTIVAATTPPGTQDDTVAPGTQDSNVLQVSTVPPTSGTQDSTVPSTPGTQDGTLTPPPVTSGEQSSVTPKWEARLRKRLKQETHEDIEAQQIPDGSAVIQDIVDMKSVDGKKLYKVRWEKTAIQKGSMDWIREDQFHDISQFKDRIAEVQRWKDSGKTKREFFNKDKTAKYYYIKRGSHSADGDKGWCSFNAVNIALHILTGRELVTDEMIDDFRNEMVAKRNKNYAKRNQHHMEVDEAMHGSSWPEVLTFIRKLCGKKSGFNIKIDYQELNRNRYSGNGVGVTALKRLDLENGIYFCAGFYSSFHAGHCVVLRVDHDNVTVYEKHTTGGIEQLSWLHAISYVRRVQLVNSVENKIIRSLL